MHIRNFDIVKVWQILIHKHQEEDLTLHFCTYKGFVNLGKFTLIVKFPKFSLHQSSQYPVSLTLTLSLNIMYLISSIAYTECSLM